MFGLIRILAIAATLEPTLNACSGVESKPNNEPPVIGQTDYG